MLYDTININFQLTNNATGITTLYQSLANAISVQSGTTSDIQETCDESVDFNIGLKNITPMLGLQFEQVDDGININIINLNEWTNSDKDGIMNFYYQSPKVVHHFMVPHHTPNSEIGVVIVGTVETPVIPPSEG